MEMNLLGGFLGSGFGELHLLEFSEKNLISSHKIIRLQADISFLWFSCCSVPLGAGLCFLPFYFW